MSTEVNKSLKTLREWFQGEAINQLGVALLEIEMKVGDASQDVVNGFNEMQKWVSNDVIITIKNTLESVTKKVSYASDAINQEVANLREIFSKRVVGNTFDMLSRIEDQLWDSEATMKAFWDRALESSQRFEEVFFVQGADAMIGEIAMISERVKSKIFIVAPEIEDIDIIPLKTLSSRINIRLCAAINPESQRAMQIVNEFINLSNVQIRNYDGRDVWGVSKDFEEIIVGAVSGLNVAGIGSILDQHIKYLNPVLEECWLKGKPVKSLEDLKGVAPAPKKEIKEIPKEAPKATISVSTQDVGQIKIEKPSTTHKMVINPEMASDIKEKYNTIKGGLASLPKEYIGKALEELKEYIVSKYGFNRLVFEFSKKARLIAKKPQEYMSEQEINELNAEVESWLQKM